MPQVDNVDLRIIILAAMVVMSAIVIAALLIRSKP